MILVGAQFKEMFYGLSRHIKEVNGSNTVSVTTCALYCTLSIQLGNQMHEGGMEIFTQYLYRNWGNYYTWNLLDKSSIKSLQVKEENEVLCHI